MLVGDIHIHQGNYIDPPLLIKEWVAHGCTIRLEEIYSFSSVSSYSATDFNIVRNCYAKLTLLREDRPFPIFGTSHDIPQRAGAQEIFAEIEHLCMQLTDDVEGLGPRILEAMIPSDRDLMEVSVHGHRFEKALALQVLAGSYVRSVSDNS